MLQTPDIVSLYICSSADYVCTILRYKCVNADIDLVVLSLVYRSISMDANPHAHTSSSYYDPNVHVLAASGNQRSDRGEK